MEIHTSNTEGEEHMGGYIMDVEQKRRSKPSDLIPHSD